MVINRKLQKLFPFVKMSEKHGGIAMDLTENTVTVLAKLLHSSSTGQPFKHQIADGTMYVCKI